MQEMWNKQYEMIKNIINQDNLMVPENFVELFSEFGCWLLSLYLA